MSALTHPYTYAPPLLTILMLPQDPQDMPPMLPPHVLPHPHHLPCLCSCRNLKICLQSRHPMSALTHPYASSHLPLTMLTLPQDPQDMPPKPATHLHDHPSLHLCTPSAYHAYTPAGPSRYASNASTPCLPSPILMLTHAYQLPCLCSRSTLKICLRQKHLIYVLSPPYFLCGLPSLLSCIRSIGYDGFLAYNTITEIC
ncbi:hypothetical protein O181_029927 [Austropuccinia psidii MF-1]|uniref:Uncharacterized protein n=1 Tax=Austropuccinia psidii MF-1 TaxID=1389203 RepID=A0A9Q3H3Y7_9BASI|nr:hypothetical protein [Austropuccinia psidii MF-1]